MAAFSNRDEVVWKSTYLVKSDKRNGEAVHDPAALEREKT